MALASDKITIHWRTAVGAAIIGALLGASGLRVLAPFVPGMSDAIEKQQKIMCSELVATVSVQNMDKVVALEKRVSALEATLIANGIDVPSE